jgi:co-chaperonin GroES (HSP10)
MTEFAFQPHKVSEITALHDTVIVCDMSFDVRMTSSGIIIPNDDRTSAGIRPRWAKVYAVGPEQESVSIGQYVLVAHGRWTRGVKIEDDEGEKTIRKIDPNDILMVSDTPMIDDTMSDKVLA